MFDYLEQFKRLPKELREKISSPAAMSVLSELEKKYNLALAATVMKVMVKIVPIRDLPSHFVADFSLTPEAARNLSNELRERLFFVVAGYLGLKAAPSNDEKTVAEIIKNSQLSFPSTDLNNRARHVVLTYLRGVRSKIDARDVLEKPINNGGLNLSREEATRLLNEVDHFSFRKTTAVIDEKTGQKTPDKKTAAGLENIIAKHDQQEAYDLKKELASGRTASLLASPDIKQLEAQTTDVAGVASQAKSKPAAGLKSADHLSDINELEKQLLAQELESDDSEDLNELMKQISIDEKSAKSSSTDKDGLATKKVPVVPVNNKIDAAETSVSPVAIPVSPAITPPTARSQTSTSFAPPPKKSFFARLFSKRKESTIAKIDVGQPKSVIPQSSAQPKPFGPSAQSLTKQATDKLEVKSPIGPSAQASQPSITPGQATAHSDRLADKLSTEVRAVKEPVIEKIIDKKDSHSDKLAPNFIDQKSGFFHRSAAGSDFKTKIEDIKAAPKIMGPIEELRYLDLVNFRRLGPPPGEATNKIKAKIKLMEREGYDRRLAAVAAWRKSPVSRLYITIGQEAVSKGITMKEAALARKEKNQDYLSWEEIRAIVELNSSLMF